MHNVKHIEPDDPLPFPNNLVRIAIDMFQLKSQSAKEPIWQVGEQELFRCTKYICGGMYVTTFSSTGTLLHKEGRVRPQPFFRMAAYGMWVELSIKYLDKDTKNIIKRKHALWQCSASCLLTTTLLL